MAIEIEVFATDLMKWRIGSSKSAIIDEGVGDYSVCFCKPLESITLLGGRGFR
ncbi:MAG: hypothetical protein ABIS50_19320 [Luteolibacter sp.]|uniref:hypothetical protein n=1 Tax=Luteolibacter sp. TaxID=1962973 RepID=UPI0032630793